MLLVPLTLFTSPHPPQSNFSPSSLADSLKSFTSCTPIHSEIQSIPALTSAGRLHAKNSYSGKAEYNIFSSYSTLANRHCFFPYPPTNIPTIQITKCHCLGTPHLKILSLNISKSSDPTFPLHKSSAIQNTPTTLSLSTTAVWPRSSSIAFNCIAPQGHLRVDVSVPRNFSL